MPDSTETEKPAAAKKESPKKAEAKKPAAEKAPTPEQAPPKPDVAALRKAAIENLQAAQASAADYYQATGAADGRRILNNLNSALQSA